MGSSSNGNPVRKGIPISSCIRIFMFLNILTEAFLQKLHASSGREDE